MDSGNFSEGRSFSGRHAIVFQNLSHFGNYRRCESKRRRGRRQRKDEKEETMKKGNTIALVEITG